MTLFPGDPIPKKKSSATSTKPNWLTRSLRPTDVVDEITFAQYCQQVLGTPLPKAKDIPALKKTFKEFHADYPRVDWPMLVKLVHWCRNRKRRPVSAMAVLGQLKYAWSQGHFPELDPSQQHRVDENTETAIARILDTEPDPQWRRLLLGAQGPRARGEVLKAWRNSHK